MSFLIECVTKNDRFVLERDLTVYLFIVHVYPSFTRKRIVSLSFGCDVRTRLGVAIFSRCMSGPPIFHKKVGPSRSVPCPRTQQDNLPACSLHPTLNAKRQVGSCITQLGE